MDSKLGDLLRMRIQAMFWVTCAARRVVISPTVVNIDNLQRALAEFDRTCRALVQYERQSRITQDIGEANKAWAAALIPERKDQ